ncbi:ubiquitin-domain-containing protein [Xylariomycetidae sp. FL2044]|nr:ubiquitin-domain-containing protein [Xylariomycetidae sp. FL2044]
MADAPEGTSDSQVTFKVKTSGDGQHNITMSESALVSDLKTKLAGPEFENIPIERQRLIYSGRVLKNEEPLSTYKIKSGTTVHLVKSAASNPAPAPTSTSSSSTPAAPQVPTNMAAGTANDPLAGLTGARYAGMAGLPSAGAFGPDGGMGGPMMDEDQMVNMLSDPNMVQQMNEMMNNDQLVDIMIQQNPILRNNPNAREILRSPIFRNMITSPDSIRQAARMSRMLRGQSGGEAFPMPGVTDNTPGTGSAPGANNNSASGTQQPSMNPFDLSLWGMPPNAGADQANPFLRNLINNPALFGAPPGGQTGQTEAGTTGAQAGGNATDSSQSNANSQNPSNPPPNPLAALFGAMPGGGANAGAGANPSGLPGIQPEHLQQMMQMLAMGSPGGSPAPQDNRPPEERYAEQLRQLNDMGFYDFESNIAALRRSGGSVQGAVEHLLSS